MAGTTQGEGRDASQSRPITVQGHPAAKGLRIPSPLSCWQENPFYSISIDQSCFTTALAPVLPARSQGRVRRQGLQEGARLIRLRAGKALGIQLNLRVFSNDFLN